MTDLYFKTQWQIQTLSKMSWRVGGGGGGQRKVVLINLPISVKYKQGVLSLCFSSHFPQVQLYKVPFKIELTIASSWGRYSCEIWIEVCRKCS